MMPTILEYLCSDPEEYPGWLDSAEMSFSDATVDSFFSSRVVYYPGSGHDWRAFETFGMSHSAHCFVHLDLTYSATEIREKLQPGHLHHIQGYSPVCQRRLVPGLVAHRMRLKPQHPFPDVKPNLQSALWTVLERNPKIPDDLGPRRLAFLHIQAEAVWICWNLWGQLDKNPFGVVLQDHGFGGNWNNFGRDGALQQIASSSVCPKYLLVESGVEPPHTYPWPGFIPVSNISERGYGQHGNRIQLFGCPMP